MLIDLYKVVDPADEAGSLEAFKAAAEEVGPSNFPIEWSWPRLVRTDHGTASWRYIARYYHWQIEG